VPIVEKKAIKEEAKAAPVVEKPKVEYSVVEKIEEKPESETLVVSLENKILELIEKNPHEGLRVGEMEEIIKVSKLKLGKIAKAMLDEGKVRKVDGKYFPPQSFYEKKNISKKQQTS